MHLTVEFHSTGLIIFIVVVVLGRFLLGLLNNRRSYREDREQIEKDQRIEALEAELAKQKYIL